MPCKKVVSRRICLFLLENSKFKLFSVSKKKQKQKYDTQGYTEKPRINTHKKPRYTGYTCKLTNSFVCIADTQQDAVNSFSTSVYSNPTSDNQCHCPQTDGVAACQNPPQSVMQGAGQTHLQRAGPKPLRGRKAPGVTSQGPPTLPAIDAEPAGAQPPARRPRHPGAACRT